EMEEEELKKCSNPHRIEALDFLKLDYRPPNPLNAVITNLSIDRYDRIFRLMLRMLRMQHVVKTLAGHTLTERASSRHTLRSRRLATHHRANPLEHLNRDLSDLRLKFRQEATHFLTHLTSYFTTAAILNPHGAFLSSIAKLETELLEEQQLTPRDEGLHHLRARHEKCLDIILENCFLKQRQAPVMTLLESI